MYFNPLIFYREDKVFFSVVVNILFQRFVTSKYYFIKKRQKSVMMMRDEMAIQAYKLQVAV